MTSPSLSTTPVRQPLPLAPERRPASRRVEFIEADAQSILNRVKGMPFSWTINPYRGCQHACLYCYARDTHRFLGLDPGEEFDRRIVVKRNAVSVLRRELRRPSWQRELVCLGANVDCYQPAERHFRLMPGILAALRDHLTPATLLTKSPLVQRDIPVLQELAALGLIRVNVSLAFLDPGLAARFEPGAPSPQARLETIEALSRAGIPTSLMLAPIMPGINDAAGALEALVTAARQAGVTMIAPIVLHLRPAARAWFLDHLAEIAPDLLTSYEALYQDTYAPPAVRARIHRLADPLCDGVLAADNAPAQYRDVTRLPAGQLAMPGLTDALPLAAATADPPLLEVPARAPRRLAG